MVRRLIAAALAVACAVPASAQEWPARTLTMVVPFPAGGPIDVVGRILAPPMSELLVCDVISTALPLIRSKSAKAIALLSPQRNSVLPELATADEQGLAGFDADAWNAFFLPRGTPEPIVRRLAKATSDAL